MCFSIRRGWPALPNPFGQPPTRPRTENPVTVGVLKNPLGRTIDVTRGANHASTASLVRRVAGEASVTDFLNSPTVPVLPISTPRGTESDALSDTAWHRDSRNADEVVGLGGESTPVSAPDVLPYDDVLWGRTP